MTDKEQSNKSESKIVRINPILGTRNFVTAANSASMKTEKPQNTPEPPKQTKQTEK